MESMKGVNSGHLKIAVASTINYFAPRLLAAFSKIYPGIELSLLVTNRESLVQLLKENEEDLVLMGQPPEEMDLEWEPFMENPLVVIAAPDHPLVDKKNISMQELAEETFVIRETGSGTRIAIERLFDSAGLKLKKGMQMTRNEAIKQAVRAGMGVSIVSAHTIELELETDRLAILDVEGFPLIRHWHLVHRKGKRLSPAARAFREFVMENATSI
jgi:DNA-binding transcriptional LysR family regulator